MNPITFPPDHSHIPNQFFSPFCFDPELSWSNLTDQDLDQYQTHLKSFIQPLDIHDAESIKYDQLQQAQNTQIPHIQLFRFKDICFDFLQGQNRKVSYLGTSSSNFMENEQVQTQLIKHIVSILFKIAQQQKFTYPHLFTHIKEQFYKPNILEKERLTEKTKEKYSILIDIFFNEAHETSKYDDFININQDFQDISVIFFKRIAIENYRRHQKQNLHQLNHIKTKAFQMIRNLCSKFLIQINYFGYDQPQIQMLVLANEERFVFLSESNHLFVLTLEKFELLNVRRKSSHNISVNEKSIRKSSQNKSLHKNSSSELQASAHFKTGQASQHLTDHFALNVIDSDETSNYESSTLKSQSKVHDLSEKSTPEFQHSSIAHIRKKSHKGSFGVVDFDKMVQKDLANPKRQADQKANRQRDHAKNHQLNTEVYNKKVLSERFETNELESLTYVDDEDSSIEFIPHFQMNETVQVFGNNPTSPAYYNNNLTSFSQFVEKFEFEETNSKMIQPMKGSNIEKSSQFFVNEEYLPQIIPQFKQQNSLQSQGRGHRTHSPGNRILASSQIIDFTGSYYKQQNSNNDQFQEDDNNDFLVIPSMNSEFNTISQKGENQNSSSFYSPQKDVLMSFSKNDKLKFIISDSQQTELMEEKFAKKAERGTNDTLDSMKLKEQDETANKQKTRKYSYRTQKQQRQKFRSQLKVQQQTQISQTINSFISEHTPSSLAKKPKYKPYHEINTSESIMFNQYGSTSQINMNNSDTFANHANPKDNSKLQRKHSSSIPIYKATEPPENLHRSRYPEVNFNSKNAQKRFEENSVRFSQVFGNNEDEIFYTQQNQNRQTFGNRKQRKVTDFYESPLTNLTRGGNRASQIIQNGTGTNKNQTLQSKFQGHLDISHDNANLLINSEGGKNYSVISNISYDQERRIEDLLEMQNYQTLIKRQPNHENKPFMNFTDQEIDFGNIQAIEKLLLKKKQQKMKLSGQQIVVSVKASRENVRQPKDWVKKEVFYFFEPSPLSPLRSPEKHVIMNPQRTSNKVKRQNSIKSHSQNKDIPSSSTSLYNYPMMLRQQNPQFQEQRDKSLGDRKYYVKQIKPVSQINFNNYLTQTIPIQNFNSSQYISNQNNNGILIREDKRTFQHEIDRRKVQNEFDKVSVYTQPLPNTMIRITQPLPNTMIRISPPKRLQSTVPLVIPSQHHIKISVQNLKTYPSQPIIRFTLGSTSQQNYKQSVQTHYSPNPLTTAPSHKIIPTYRIN